MKKTKLFYVLVTVFLLSWKMNAQITIGSDVRPSSGTLLDLKENSDGMSTKGLAMPRVSLKDLTNLYPMFTGSESDYATLKTTHAGLMVYNTKTQETADRICPGIHVWTGDKWKPLVSYPVWPAESKTLKSDVLVGFTLLDPNSPTNWPADKDRSQYPLGYIGTFTDSRAGDTPQTYNYTRFYVGLVNRNKTYEVQGNYSCGTTPVYVSTITTEAENTFEDGVWMNDNLRAEIMDPVRDDGDPALTMINSTAGSFNIAAWGYPINSANKNTLGLLYNWAAATNGKGGETGQEGTVNEGGLAEGVKRQGVCPSGWHLPSDREWTTLENAIITNTSIFSTMPTIGTILDYTSSSRDGINHGAAMKSTTSTNGTTASNGTSNPAAQGGFNGLLSGYGTGIVMGFGTAGYWWSSSIGYRDVINNVETAWYRTLTASSASIICNNATRRLLYSVRCKRN